MDRRTLLITAGLGAVAAPGFAAAQSTEVSDDVVDYLFVQAGPTVSLENGTLRLEGANPQTVYFSDRPDRIAGVVTTQEFVDQWGEGTDSFREDPPNAVLVLHEQETPIVSAIVLHDPQYSDGTLAYTVDVIDGQHTISGGWSSLFIDTIGRPATPLSFAGTARRAGRRTARRVAWRT